MGSICAARNTGATRSNVIPNATCEGELREGDGQLCDDYFWAVGCAILFISAGDATIEP